MFQKQRDNIPENIRTMIELKKATEDTKKALGQSFMTVINSIVNAFGGLKSTLTAFLTFYALYKSAMIISNTAIGISKALALGSVFASPLAFGIGAAALSSLLAMGVGTGIAINSIQNSNIGENASNTGTDIQQQTLAFKFQKIDSEEKWQKRVETITGKFKNGFKKVLWKHNFRN
ncbi:hypothetical protein NW066_01655 [Mycoplasmopsis felis]|uniref:hypothetical protein n=1 Tax=Mycoplasmopsis felis TaxID=33923 RepID=UPI0021AF0692|nr:hypothetical protein [Mycoplasmopsis felis]UWV85410.1 hypothetical protein NW066_01655 [Mycoplasmopsis felis]